MRPPRKITWLIVRAFGIGLFVATHSFAANPYLEVPAEETMLATPAYRFANASNDEVRTWITERKLPFSELPSNVDGVRLAGRLVGPLHGVWIHGTDPSHAEQSPYEVIDGRLALALDEFCTVLSKAHVVEILHYTIYRPNLKPSTDFVARTRHGGALAIDIGALKLEDGTWLSVKRDWSPAIGAKTCGFGERIVPSEAGRIVQSWVCEARQQGIFHYALTPHFDAAHADHLHLEIKPVVKWFLYN